MTDTSRRVELEAQLSKLSARDLQLWSIGFLVMIVLALALVSSLLPDISNTSYRVEVRYVPQIALGLIALVLLLNFYLIGKNRELRVIRQQLIHELAANETLERYSLIDPETGLFTRSYLPHLLSSESKRCNRSGSSVAFVVLDVLWTHDAGTPSRELARAATGLLKSTFRGTDTLLRLDTRRFLVTMPETTKEQAQIALNRLQHKLDEWNLESTATEMMVHYTVGGCGPGVDASAALQEVEEQLQHLRNVDLAAVKLARTPVIG